MHGVIGLPHCEEQDWHRDAPLLFPDCPAFGAESVHARAGGVHLPPYAVNVFYTLTPLTERNGGPEFAPGSHQWGEQYSDEPCFRDQVRPNVSSQTSCRSTVLTAVCRLVVTLLSRPRLGRLLAVCLDRV